MRFGKVNYFESANQDSFADVIKGLALVPPVIIKPNWGFSVVFTEAKLLDWALSAIDGDTIVVESYGWARCEDAVAKKKYGSFKKDDLRKSDQWFLNYSGIGKILEKHGVEYLNITEEVWAGRTTETKTIKQLVEDSFSPVHNREMYSYVPDRLYRMRGGSFLSLAKLKFMGDSIVISLSIKNLFGMIPGPSRGKFHGPENSLMDQSIVDINKIYRSLFELKGVVEAVFTATRGMTLEPTIYKDRGHVWACEDTLELDATVSSHVGVDPHSIGHLNVAADCFGSWDDVAVSRAKENVILDFE